MRRLSSTLASSLLVLFLVLFVGLGVVRAFSTFWSTHWDGGNSELNQWSGHNVGACSGQSHSVSGSQVHMRAADGARCFGAYYRENSTRSTFPTDQDVRVIWRWRYPEWGWFGTQAGQLTGRYGWPQYYGVSGVDIPTTRYAHVEAYGPWGHWDVDSPIWKTNGIDTGWHSSVFDFICDGTELKWYVDSNQVLSRTGSAIPPGHNDRPYQFWFGNLLDDAGPQPGKDDWNGFDIDYITVYAVERPAMNTPAPGSGGTQPVSWNTVPNTQLPDGSTPGVEYQTRACTDANCSNVVATSPWTSGTTHTFTGLGLNRTYYYQVRARWVTQPTLNTCWSPAVPADMTGEPQIAVSKSGPATVEPGETIDYTIIVQNTGDAPATGVVAHDPIPQYVTNPTNISNGGSVQGNEIVWNLGTLNAGESVTLSWRGTLDASAPTSVSQVTNTAEACDSANHCDDGSTTTTILRPGISVTKGGPATVEPGGIIQYSITVRSTGSATLRGVVARDPIPQYVTNPTNISNGGSVQGGEIVWNLGDLAPGASVTLSWEGTVDPTTPETVTSVRNRVTVTGSGLTDEAEATTSVLFPEITVGKSGPIDVVPGEIIQYTILVRNTGTAPLAGVVAHDPIPLYVSNPTNISGGGTVDGDEIVWNLGDPSTGSGQVMAPGASVTLSWEGTVDPKIPATVDQLVNVVQVCDDADHCDEAWFPTQVLKPALSVVKNASPYVYPHGDVVYEIVVENVGQVALEEVVVSDPLPEYVLYPRGISHDGQAVESPFEGEIQVVWYLGDLEPGQSVTLSWWGTVDPATPDEVYAIRNVATVTTSRLTRQAEASSYVLHSRMILHKSATVAAEPGGLVGYTLTVENHGWAPAYGVEVHDPIPQYIVDARNANQGGEVRADEVYWYLDLLQPYESRSLTWEGSVDPLVPAEVAQIENVATVCDMVDHPEGSPPFGHCDEAYAYTNLNTQGVYAYKTASYLVWPGGPIQFGIVIQNRGAAVLNDIVVRDPVPDYVTWPTNISHGGILEGNLEVVWHIGALGPGQEITLTWEGLVDPQVEEEPDIWNQAALSTGGGLTYQVQSKSYLHYPLLSLVKGATKAAGPGETVAYTLIVENISDVPALEVEVRDPIPEYITNPSNISGGGALEAVPIDAIVWDLGSVAPGQKITLTWEGTVGLDIPATWGQIDNLAAATELTGRVFEARATTKVLRPAINLSKSAPAEVAPGQALAYTLVVTNAGQMTLRQAVVRDLIPAYVTNPTGISNGGTIQPALSSQGGDEIVWNLGDMAPGASATLSWRGTLDRAIPVGTLEVRNRAMASAWPGVQAQAEAVSAVLQPELEMTKTATTPVMPGDLIDYHIRLDNQGRTTIYGLQIEDFIPPYVVPYRIHDGGYELPGGRIVWDAFDMSPASSRTVTWQGRLAGDIPPEESSIHNLARASALGGLTVEAEAVSHVLKPGLVISKTAAAAAYAGGDVEYTVRLTNNGPGLERSIVVRDPLPPFVEHVPDVAPTFVSYGQIEENENEIVWRLDRLGPDQTAELRWRGQVAVDIPPEVEIVVNQVQATSYDTPEPIHAAAVTALLRPELHISQTCAAYAQAGDVLQYGLHIANTGAGTARQVVVHEPLPRGTGYVPGSASGDGQLDGEESLVTQRALRWDLGTLAPGAAVDLEFTLEVDPDLVAAYVNSTARLSALGEAEMIGSCQTDLVVPELSVAKAAPEEALANETIEYEISVENTGLVVAHHTVLTDTLPMDYATYIPGTASHAGAVSDSNIVWRLGDLEPGQAVTRRFQVQVHTTGGVTQTLVYNEAQASADRAQRVWDNAITLVPRPVLNLAKSATAETSPGETITYTLSGGNDGPGLARQVVLEDVVPGDLVVVETSIGDGGYYAADRHAVVWPLGDLAEGEMVERSFEAIVPLNVRPQGQPAPAAPWGPGQLDNVAHISSPDAMPASAHASTIVSSTFTVVGLKLATPYAEPGGRIDYTLQVHNGSPNVAANVIIRDPLPEYTTYITGTTSTPSAFENDGRTLVWNIGTMASGETAEIRFSVQVDDPVPDWLDRAVNIAWVSYSGGSFEVRAMTQLPGAHIEDQAEPTPEPPTPTPAPPPPGAPTPTPIPPRPPVVNPPVVSPTPAPTPTAGPTPLPGPGLSKTVSPATVEAGQVTTLTWTLIFSNPTPLTIGGVVVRDPLPVGLAYVGSDVEQPALGSPGGEIEITGGLTETIVVAHLGDVDGGGRAEITIHTLVLSDTVGGTVYTNTATYSALNADPGTSNQAVVVVEGATILPVTGGLLDPRTPQGRLAWGGLLMVAIPGGAIALLRRRSGKRAKS
jgi:uncharacterized repeat protein (TIGR01451 family)